ncbi:hypothetical protein Gohar_022415 [Gossypium harknessii]|uniref:Uncharacterized protein n=1 Tax=Gossypium harknessii TaxID=34285 RepID=A0A7J9ICR5_9ROSI|nr:hypothetical protein [Gossypium harknessii]
MSMKEFLMKVKGCCDSLASCGEVISEHEHVTAILNGLPPKYESVITIVTASQVPYIVQGVTFMLLDAEARQQVVNCEVSSSANMVSYQSTDSVPNGLIPPY